VLAGVGEAGDHRRLGVARRGFRDRGRGGAGAEQGVPVVRGEVPPVEALLDDRLELLGGGGEGAGDEVPVRVVALQEHPREVVAVDTRGRIPAVLLGHVSFSNGSSDSPFWWPPSLYLNYTKSVVRRKP